MLTHLVITQLALTQLALTNLSTHHLLTHHLSSHNLLLAHTHFAHTQLVLTQLVHTHNLPSQTQLCVAGVALGDMDLHFAWQAWHLATWILTLRGSVALAALGWLSHHL